MRMLKHRGVGGTAAFSAWLAQIMHLPVKQTQLHFLPTDGYRCNKIAVTLGWIQTAV